jgi:hypothetical protein
MPAWRQVPLPAKATIASSAAQRWWITAAGASDWRMK